MFNFFWLGMYKFDNYVYTLIVMSIWELSKFISVLKHMRICNIGFTLTNG